MISSWTFFWLFGGEVKSESASSNLPLPTGLGSIYVLVGSIPLLTFNFSHLVGVSVSTKQLKDISVCIVWWGTRTLPQAALLFLLTAPPLSPILSIPWLATAWTCLLELREDRRNSMKNRRTRGHREAFVPRSPTTPCSVSLWAIQFATLSKSVVFDYNW